MSACSVTSVMSSSLGPYGLQSPSLLCPWDSSGENTRMGCHAFLQGAFPTQGWTQVSCISCIAGRFFTAEPPGKTQEIGCHQLNNDTPYVVKMYSNFKDVRIFWSVPWNQWIILFSYGNSLYKVIVQSINQTNVDPVSCICKCKVHMCLNFSAAGISFDCLIDA